MRISITEALRFCLKIKAPNYLHGLLGAFLSLLPIFIYLVSLEFNGCRSTKKMVIGPPLGHLHMVEFSYAAYLVTAMTMKQRCLKKSSHRNVA